VIDADPGATHVAVRRPWGSYTVLDAGEGFKVKRIEVLPGGVLSLQMHHHRDEHWIVVCGRAEVTLDGSVFFMEAGAAVAHIPATIRHRLANREKTPLVLIEVQQGVYLGEDDIVRFADVYGRAPGA
jgi:mannose-1-phosphate guanylyltransferase/mannose-6-phosphate isomerase